MNTWEYFGGTNYSDQMYQKELTVYLDKVLVFLYEELDIDYKKYHNFVDLVMNTSNNYFFEWLRFSGLGLIKTIVTNQYSETDELLDFIEYRIVVLQMDIDSGIISNVYYSIADTFDLLKNRSKVA